MAFNIDNLSLSLFINDKSNEELQETNNRFNSRYIEDVLDTLIQNRHYSEPINSIDTHFIEDYTYVCNNNLSDIELNNTTFIGIGAFEYCIGLTSIELPSNIVKILFPLMTIVIMLLLYLIVLLLIVLILEILIFNVIIYQIDVFIIVKI